MVFEYSVVTRFLFIFASSPLFLSRAFDTTGFFFLVACRLSELSPKSKVGSLLMSASEALALVILLPEALRFAVGWCETSPCGGRNEGEIKILTFHCSVSRVTTCFDDLFDRVRQPHIEYFIISKKTFLKAIFG